MLPSVGNAVIKVIADGVNSSPGRVKRNQLLSEVGYDERQRRLIATDINHHFFDERGQAFYPWLAPADTAQDQKVAAVIRNVQERNPHKKTKADPAPP